MSVPNAIKVGCWPVGVFLLSSFLYVISFPPWNIAEGAYLFAIPFLFWIFYKPGFKLYLITALITGCVTWIVMIWWLRHITYLGTVSLAVFLGLFNVTWLVAAWWALPRIIDRPFWYRLSGLLGLSSLWILLEYLRTFLITGFPWLPLALSQWNRPALLQIISYTGFYGISFILIFFNLGIAIYLRHLILKSHRGRAWYERICPEFYLSVALLLTAASGVIWTGTFTQDRVDGFRVAVIQPYIKPSIKWISEQAHGILDILEKHTLFLKPLDPDLILWPESVTPWPVVGDSNMRLWAQDRAQSFGVPILMGNMAKEDNKIWYNTVNAVDPRFGLVFPYYAKRKLVPFGEYVPFHQFFPFIDKFVPLEADFKPGKLPELIPLNIAGQIYRVGPLICYEDIFPGLARDLTLEGADFLFVATNDAWYGEESGAYQHAAHSVLRAVETRRPVLRCGNAGWSGWIDEYGNVRDVLLDHRGSIYFRGGAVMEVSRDRQWTQRLSVYMQYGDWFVGLSFFSLVWGFIALRFLHVDRVPDAPEPDFRTRRQRIFGN